MAGTPLATAFVRIRPDTSGFGSELQRDVNKAGGKMGATGNKAGKKFGAGFAIGLTAVVAGGAALAKFGGDSVRAFSESQQAQTRLQDAFARFPKLAGTNIQALRDLNTALAQKTRFDDDALASGQAIIAQFGLTGRQVADITPLIADYAAKTGKDIPNASKVIGKAFLGNTRALKELGINYKLTGDKTKDMAAIQDLLRQKVGGFAEKEGKTAAGQAQILKNRFGEFQEAVGSKLLPVLTTLATGLIALFGVIERNKTVIAAIAIGIGAALVPAFIAWAIAAGAAAVATIAAAAPLILVGIAVAALALLIIKNWDTIKRVTLVVWNFIKTAVTTAVSAVIGFVRRNWPLLVAILTGPIGIAVLLITKNWDKIKRGATTVYTWIKDTFNKVVSFIRGLPGKIASAASGLFQGIVNAFKSAVNFIISGWNRLEFRIPGFDPPGPGPKFGGFTLGVPDIPLLDTGGWLPPGLSVAMNNTGRAERVLGPREKAGNTYTITVNVPPNANQHEIGRQIVQSIRAYEQGSGKGWRR